MKLNPDNVYDPLAKDYDDTLLADPNNELIRHKVRTLALKYLKPQSKVLDFGGGTGQDLNWLSTHCADLTFFEPSLAMRLIAEEKIKTHQFKNVTVVNNSDFRKWDFVNVPKSADYDFILSNFAVFNSIFEIDLLFEQLSKCLEKDGILLISILNQFPENYNGLKVWKKIVNKLRLHFSEKSFVLKNSVHNTILHSHKKTLSTSKTRFRLLFFEKIPSSMFTVYLFKKE